MMRSPRKPTTTNDMNLIDGRDAQGGAGHETTEGHRPSILKARKQDRYEQGIEHF